jgi:hypothetical protein
MSRLAIEKKQYKFPADYDANLNKMIGELEQKCPEPWSFVLSYIRSLCLPWEIDPQNEELVKSEWHKKAVLTKLVKRLNGLEEIN